MKMDEYLEQHGLEKEVFAVDRKRKEDNPWDGTLTNMQCAVLEGEPFWDTQKNLIIQGATSSGKTLLAEIAAYRQIEDDSLWRKKVIFLVPLRALVTAQCDQVKQDFAQVRIEGNPLRIFESSADYQDHDEEIVSGEYDIAVIVYEKFFALLSSRSVQGNNMLRNCGLVVVDELQMLSNKDRGPKMEFSIMQLLEMQQQGHTAWEEDTVTGMNENIRVIGLTTSESGVDALAAWMHADIVGNKVRPVPMRQYIISYESGRYQYRDIPGETDAITPDDCGKNSGEIELLPRFEAGKRDEDKKRKCLYSLLSQWLENDEENMAQKILIFANSKSKTRSIAKEIALKFSSYQNGTSDNANKRETLEQTLQEFNDEDGINDLSNLIARGIAFHHSGIPAVVRKQIEDNFQDRHGCIQIIVCTETLMIGMNLPADIVILYDGTVFRGSAAAEPLSVQAYNNFVGRAGRLGMGNKEDYHGESYLLTENLIRDNNRYTADAETTVRSPFSSAHPQELAPYFPNWIGANQSALERIETGLRISYCYCSQKESHELANISQDILTRLLEAVPVKGHEMLKQNNNGEYHLSNIGNALAPYALSPGTCKILVRYVISNRVSAEDVGFVASDDGESRLPSKPLLDLIYTICTCAEVDTNPALSTLGNNQARVKALNLAIQNYLKEIYKQEPEQAEEDAAHTEAVQSADKKLAQIAHSDFCAEPDDLRQALRTLVLCLWMGGYRVRRIKEILKISDLTITTSDIERIAEAAAYLLEAASNCQENQILSADASLLYRLSIQMKYGVPYELVCLANTHVRGVTRNRLLNIRREAHHMHKTPRDYILASAYSRYQGLREALIEREKIGNYQQQIENIQAEDTSLICKKIAGHLQNLDAHSGSGIDGCMDALQKIFVAISDAQGRGWSVSPVLENLQINFMAADSRAYCLHLKLFDMREENEEEEKKSWYTQIGHFYAETSGGRNQRIVKIAVLYGTPPLGEEELPPDMLVISSELLGILVSKCIRDSAGGDAIQLIYRILSDLKGSFILNGTSAFRDYGAVSNLIRGYMHTEPEEEKPGLLFYDGIMDLDAASPFAAIAWGHTESKPEPSYCPAIALYHPAFHFSRSAEALLDKCDSIFCTHDDYALLCEAYVETKVVVTDNIDLDEMLKSVVKMQQQPERTPFQYDFGISLRAQYCPKMEPLRIALERCGKKVLLMTMEEFRQQMAGKIFVEALYKEFSACRQIIVCDTYDYDQSPYTAFVEFNVIMDKLFYARENKRRAPVHRVKLPDKDPSHLLGYVFKNTGNVHTYIECEIEKLAKAIIEDSEKIENDPAAF